jgi:hypothetical protein
LSQRHIESTQLCGVRKQCSTNISGFLRMALHSLEIVVMMISSTATAVQICLKERYRLSKAGSWTTATIVRTATTHRLEPAFRSMASENRIPFGHAGNEFQLVTTPNRPASSALPCRRRCSPASQCESCNQAMVQCRQKVGHQPGYSCAKCRKALDQCRAGAIPSGK